MIRRGAAFVALVVLVAAVLLVVIPTIIGLNEPPRNEMVYVVLKTTQPDMEFWQTVRAGIEAAATDYDLRPIIVGPRRETDVERQLEILEEVIEVGPDAILLVASDFTRPIELAERASERGITIVTLDSALNSDVPVSFVATDNVAAGRLAGEEITRLVSGRERIAVLSHIPGVATAIDRERGVRDALAGHETRVLATLYSNNDPDMAYSLVTNLVAEYPDLGGIVALNENSTVGAGRALRELNAAERIHLVGFDNSQEEIEFMEEGVINALVVQRPFNMGYVGIRTVASALRGEVVAPVIHTDAVLVRRNEMFSEENQRLLFPLVRTRPAYDND